MSPGGQGGGPEIGRRTRTGLWLSSAVEVESVWIGTGSDRRGAAVGGISRIRRGSGRGSVGGEVVGIGEDISRRSQYVQFIRVGKSTMQIAALMALLIVIS